MDVGRRRQLSSVIYAGAGSVPLFAAADFREVASRLAAGGVVTNNSFSSDLVAFPVAETMLPGDGRGSFVNTDAVLDLRLAFAGAVPFAAFTPPLGKIFVPIMEPGLLLFLDQLIKRCMRYPGLWPGRVFLFQLYTENFRGPTPVLVLFNKSKDVRALLLHRASRPVFAVD